MKARFFALAALVLGMVSCQQDVDTIAPVGGEVDFQISVAAPELAGTRAGENGVADTQNAMDSAFGAIDYLQGATTGDYRQDWGDVDLRYTLEVYDVADSYAGAVPVKDRQVVIVDEYAPVVFDLRLVPGRDYHFVVFADFVAQDEYKKDATAQLSVVGIRHEIGATLADITLKNEAINDEVADSYFATKDIKVTNSAAQDIVLKRPYGKVRVIATDLAELNLNVHPFTVELEYEKANPNKFNAVTGELNEGTYAATAFKSGYVAKVRNNMGSHYYNVGYDAETAPAVNGTVRNTHMTLFTDYILALPEGQTPIHFTMVVKDEAGVVIKETAFTTDIPVERNKLTTVIGNVLTTATEIEVRIDDNFAGELVETLWDGKSATAPAYDDATKTYTIYEESELAWLADQVNGVENTRATANSFEGYTIKLGDNLHLNYENWTPIGATGTFKGTFDGAGFAIEGLRVYAENGASAGLFANCRGTIKNLTVIDAEIYGHYKAGVISGDGLCAKIENCHVKDAIVESTPWLTDKGYDDANNVGGIVGYLSAEPTAYVKGCTVTDAKITAYRKVGGVVGAANGAAEVSGNTATNVIVTADQTVEYKEVKAAEAGAIVGYKHANATVEENTITGGDVIVKLDSVAEMNANKADNEIAHVTLDEGTYNFTEALTVNGAIQANLGGNVVLNANGQNITTGTSADYGFIALGEGNSLEINDANISTNGGCIAAVNGAQVTFNGDKLALTTAITNPRYNFYAEGAGSKIIVNGGDISFSAKTLKRAYVYAGEGTEVIINGGTFGTPSTQSSYKEGIRGTGKVTIYGGTFGFDPSKWVAPTCTVKKVGENWVVMKPEVATAEELAARLQDNIKEINVTLTEDIDLPISSLGQQTGGSGEYKLGGEATEKITIDLNGKTLNITTTYWSAIGAKNADALFTIKNGTMTSTGNSAGTWNSYDLTFSNCDYVFENVVFAKAVAFDNAGKKVTMKDVTINETHDYYAMWITAAGQNVAIDGLTINSDGRGIKIDEQYVDAPAKVTLNVKNATFNTVNKSAIIVKSEAGADITLENVDIANVAADPAFAVWVDEDAADYADLVTVTGGLKKVEGATATLGQETISAGTYKFPAADNFTATTVLTCEEGTVFEGNNGLNINGATVVGATFKNDSGNAVGGTINGTFKNCTFTGSNALRYCYAGENVVFENCVFDGDLYGVHFDGGANDATFKNCVFSGFNAFGSALTLLTLEGCTFKAGRCKTYNGANLWGSTKMKDCKFIFDGSVTYEWIDCISTSGTYSFDNCEINGVAYTADNYTSYLYYIESRNDITAKINGVDCAM